MKLDDIEIGEQYEESYSDFPVTVLAFRRDFQDGRQKVLVRRHDGRELPLSPTRIARPWTLAEKDRATIVKAQKLVGRLNALGVASHALGEYGNGKPGMISIRAITLEEAERLLAKLEGNAS